MIAHPQSNGEGPLYGIKLDVFEGPLDLLLYLIRKAEIDIYDIPIADITRQFLEYVEIIKTLNLEQAGDFILMAATLMKVKSRMLLPSDGEEEEEEDPREELVRRLLEYQQFKEVAGWLEGEQEAHRDTFYRGSSLNSDGLQDTNGDPLEAYRSVGLFDLMAAFKAALAAAPRGNIHSVDTLDVTTEERAGEILEKLIESRQLSFSLLVAGLPKILMIVIFIAVLELIKTGDVVARQTDSEGEIWIYRAERPVPEAGENSAGDVGDE